MSTQPSDQTPWTLLNGTETLGRVLQLLKDARERVVLISPYLDLGGRDLIGHEITAAMKRNVLVTVITRSDSTLLRDARWRASMKAHVENGLRLYSVEGLHAKVYYSEKAAIVTSLNLLRSSVLGSIEFGLASSDPVALRQVNLLVKNEIKEHTKLIDLDAVPSPGTNDGGAPWRRSAPTGEASSTGSLGTRTQQHDNDEDDNDGDDACFRCGRTGHWEDECYARTDVDGDPLDDEDEEDD